MTTATPKEIIEQLRLALESGNNHQFIDQFAGDGVFEQPFASNGIRRIEGIAKLREAFGSSNPMHRQFETHEVHVTVYEGKDMNVATVVFSIKGKSIATDELFYITSSVAIIRFDNSKIINYQDFTNTIGTAKIAGALPQLFASLK